MGIVGLQKMTLLDYPGKVACTLFVSGCNFRCPFCHNAELLAGDLPPALEEEEFLAFLEKRRGILEGVCITGGEPTLFPGLFELIRRIRQLGYPVKLDTNGSRPRVLEALLEEGLLDYVAMDVKNAPGEYGATVGLSELDLEPVRESMTLLVEGSVAYEFRTTLMAEYHTDASIEGICQWLGELFPGRKVARYYLQPFQDRDTVPRRDLHAPSKEELKRWQKRLLTCAQEVEIRGM